MICSFRKSIAFLWCLADATARFMISFFFYKRSRKDVLISFQDWWQGISLLTKKKSLAKSQINLERIFYSSMLFFPKKSHLLLLQDVMLSFHVSDFSLYPGYSSQQLSTIQGSEKHPWKILTHEGNDQSKCNQPPIRSLSSKKYMYLK